MYFGSAENKCCETPQMFGRMEGDFITLMPPIKLKTIIETIIVFLNFISNYCFSISFSQWHLSIEMHKLTFAQFVILATSHYLYCMTSCVVYSCRDSMIFMQEMKSCRGGLIKPSFWISIDEKRVDIGSEVHIGSRNKVLSSFRA